MRRNIDLKEISDGRLYSSNDMVKADCNGCNGCFSCCRGMGNSIVLDPLDVYRLKKNLRKPLMGLLQSELELNVVDSVILPNLKMLDHTGCCPFLNKEGRCSIHEFRPGICRLFPLGRYYEDEQKKFHYFLQVHECPKKNKTKIKVSKWIDTPNLKIYEKFVTDWHYFLEDLEGLLKNVEETEQKNINMYVLKCFYMQPYPNDEEFYSVFYNRLQDVKHALKLGEKI